MVAQANALRGAATAAHQAGKHAEAMAHYAAYLALRPNDAGIWSNLGVLHRAAGRHDQALRAQKRAVTLAPEDVGLRNNYANILSDIGDYDASLEQRFWVLEHEPDNLNQLAMVGRCLRGQGKYKAAIKHLEAAINRFPQDAELAMQLAFAQMADGQYAKGFESYKVRWRAGELAPRNLPFPEWQGEPLQGKTIVVMPEQGFGDAVIFARFLTVLNGTGATVKLMAEKPVLRLFQDVAGADAVVSQLATKDADYWVNMMDLAALHFSKNATVPAPTKLHVPLASVQRARQITAPFENVVKVGVVWTGSLTYKGNAFRSFSHKDFLPLVDIPGVQLFSLYKGPMVAPYQADGSAAFILDAASTETDFADCAATMQQMDVIITSDTATAHVAGSLGVPVWTILHWDPFWLWQHKGGKTDWYPSMRLFRQDSPRDWGSALAKVEKQLVRFVKDKT